MTDVNGVYSLPGLPPGVYAVRFELSAMRTADARAEVVLGGIVTLDQQLEIAPVSEAIEVRASTPAPVTSPAGAVNLRTAQLGLLPVGRMLFLLAELTPGLTDNTPSQQQLTIGGGFAYDNVFLLNGVDINDNVLGQANALFIEEGIEEVQVLTSGIPAEYGRFGGGVINVITRSGGNGASGGFRLNLTNSAWSSETPFERARHDAGQPAVAGLRGHARRPDPARSRVVLRRHANRAFDDVERVRADGHPVHEHE